MSGLSDQFNFAPSLGEICLQAFHMCGIRPSSLTQEHMFSARMAANLLLGRWSGQTPNLWSVDLQTIDLVEGQATYPVPPNTVAILDAYIIQNQGNASINRLILPISRSEYASYPNPNEQGATTVFWFDRLLAPTITFWPVPNGEFSQASYYRVRQAMDANFTNQQQVEIPYYWSEAFVTGLAQRLARIWAPALFAGLKADADEAYAIASTQNVETAVTYIAPSVSAYFRP